MTTLECPKGHGPLAENGVCRECESARPTSRPPSRPFNSPPPEPPQPYQPVPSQPVRWSELGSGQYRIDIPHDATLRQRGITVEDEFWDEPTPVDESVVLRSDRPPAVDPTGTDNSSGSS